MNNRVNRIIPLLEARDETLLALKPVQEELKPSWNTTSLTFSHGNHCLNRNLRSYFDRWRDNSDYSETQYEPSTLLPSWTLKSAAKQNNQTRIKHSLRSAVINELYFSQSSK